MSEKDESPDKDEEEEAEPEPKKEEIEEEPAVSAEKEIQKIKPTAPAEAESDSETLGLEITDLLKKARVAIGAEQFLEAIKLYQEAAISADMMGDSERQKIYLNRANELVKEHPELEKELVTEPLKKRKGKAKVRKEEEKLTLPRLIARIVVAAIFTGLIFSGIFAAVLLQNAFQVGGSYNGALLWFICTVVEVIGLTIAYFFGTRWLKWPE
ncbi:MAG: hypothetical protein LUQ65_13895 [Candidatus Helarchaeota archaeon]|nr:hypothetical protein [Candidatus Helarchaeota archaeon]